MKKSLEFVISILQSEIGILGNWIAEWQSCFSSCSGPNYYLDRLSLIEVALMKSWSLGKGWEWKLTFRLFIGLSSNPWTNFEFGKLCSILVP